MNLHDIPIEKRAIIYSGIYYNVSGLFWTVGDTVCSVCKKHIHYSDGDYVEGQSSIYDHYSCATSAGHWIEDAWVCDCETCYFQSRNTTLHYDRYTHYYEANYDDEDPETYTCYYCSNGDCPTLPPEIANGLS